MAVKARFWVRDITLHGNSEHIDVVLVPVIRSVGMPGDGENVDWAKYTPSGEIKLNVSAAGGQQFFLDNRGKDVAITFEAIPE